MPFSNDVKAIQGDSGTPRFRNIIRRPRSQPGRRVGEVKVRKETQNNMMGGEAALHRRYLGFQGYNQSQYGVSGSLAISLLRDTEGYADKISTFLYKFV
jgi:hypothetical protein